MELNIDALKHHNYNMEHTVFLCGHYGTKCKERHLMPLQLCILDVYRLPGLWITNLYLQMKKLRPGSYNLLE
jgi:hypothetical protein